MNKMKEMRKKENQGCIMDHAVAYFEPVRFAERQAYVALSSVRSLDGLRVGEQLDCTKLTGKTSCSEKTIKKMERMQQLRTQAS
ncbi:hypothetical protein TNIN_286481 [Trichonephila inaurata madagascariensis]|uniref:Uncharacterized protein n=1 Tax=Trichonephila inaurata madagascariensis TaxID=2747483 RepID=A0A8X6JJM0_9ARAC|nr:hypothetical protein TNIN_286481 [Trichonephila inaurata madagascariensis]